MKILFVCLGNICRSPMAETIFRKQVEEAGLQDRITIDSAGTAGYHIGEKADKRMRMHAENRNYTITSRGRQVEPTDFAHFDRIVAMDDSNMQNLRRICPKEYLPKLNKITDFAQKHSLDEVPDPYYGGAEGFELVIDLLEDACEGLLATVKREIS